MAFRTKLDFSSNRQVKQHEKTTTVLSGGTEFGLPYSAMTYGPDLTTSAITQSFVTITGTTSTFSGNNTTTNYVWFDSRMTLGESVLSAITSATSASTQNTGDIYTTNTTTIIDGNTVNLTYSGVSFDVIPVTVIDLGGGDYSGTVRTYRLDILSANTLDFTGRTIWNDVHGITRTEKLIITKNPQVGYVWTCLDSEGMGEWQYNGSSSASTLWVEDGIGNTAIKDVHGSNSITGTSDYSIIAGGYNSKIWDSNYASTLGTYKGVVISSPVSSIVGGDETLIKNSPYSFIGAGGANVIDDSSYSSIIAGGGYISGGTNNGIFTSMSSFIYNSMNSVIIGGLSSVINGKDRSVILGGDSLSASSVDTTYTSNLSIDYQDGSYSSLFGVNTPTPQYPLDIIGSSDIRLYFTSTSAGGLFNLTGATALPRIAVTTDSGIDGSGGVSLGMRAWNDVTYSAYGSQGDTTLYSSTAANGLNLISSNGTGTEDYIRFWAGGDCSSPSSMAMHIHGTGSTKGYVGINTLLPTQRLDVNGNGRFRSIGSSASAGALHYTADGTLTTNTSDVRLKTNISTLTNALDKVKQLRGVTYNWSENPSGDTRIGFIAQEVSDVVPELTFVNPNSTEKYMGVHYDNVTALLVEAVKELSYGNIISNNTYLETQTILAEDNNIELNYSGSVSSAIGGGIRVLHAMGQDNTSELVTDENGDFTTNTDFKAKSLTIPTYTPTSSEDINGNIGNITRDEDYLYIKGIDGWKRTNLERF